MQGGPWCVVGGGYSKVIALVTMMNLMMIVNILCLYALYTASGVQGKVMHFKQ